MDVNTVSVVPGGRQLIQGYDTGGFRIAGIRMRARCWCCRSRRSPGRSTCRSRSRPTAWRRCCTAAPAVEILVLGCGARFVMIPAELRASLKAAGIVVEAMDTGAACRTFNLLLAEDRRVAAALIAL